MVIFHCYVSLPEGNQIADFPDVHSSSMSCFVPPQLAAKLPRFRERVCFILYVYEIQHQQHFGCLESLGDHGPKVQKLGECPRLFWNVSVGCMEERFESFWNMRQKGLCFQK